jgi:hypothetical protein
MMVLLKSMIIGTYSFLPRSGFVQRVYVHSRARRADHRNAEMPQNWLVLLLIHILFMGFCPTRSYPFF